ncbi:MAG TPA: iron-containing redox enzyme family protein [Kofleriaceae bacterium]|nr:iron-containing redox enzyme family protein [Kofleriaceae bacterium]
MLSELQIYLNELDSAIEATPWRDRMVYGAFLAQTSYYVSHSTRLLALAASRFKLSEEALHRRFIKHATEEMSHETLALRDLKQIGLSLAQFPEFPSTRAFYQTQYYMIEHQSPWAFWGYILMLEGLALTKGPWLFNEIKRHHGEKAGGFVKLHAAEDVEHMAEAEKALQALPERERPVVIEQIASSCFHYCTMLQQCTTHGAHVAARPDVAAPGLPT